MATPPNQRLAPFTLAYLVTAVPVWHHANGKRLLQLPAIGKKSLSTAFHVASVVAYHLRQRSHTETQQGGPMAKGEQRSNKMAKKPKKDNSLPKESQGSDRPMPPMTAVIPRGKEKTK